MDVSSESDVPIIYGDPCGLSRCYEDAAGSHGAGTTLFNAAHVTGFRRLNRESTKSTPMKIRHVSMIVCVISSKQHGRRSNRRYHIAANKYSAKNTMHRSTCYHCKPPDVATQNTGYDTTGYQIFLSVVNEKNAGTSSPVNSFRKMPNFKCKR